MREAPRGRRSVPGRAKNKAQALGQDVPGKWEEQPGDRGGFRAQLLLVGPSASHQPLWPHESASVALRPLHTTPVGALSRRAAGAGSAWLPELRECDHCGRSPMPHWQPGTGCFSGALFCPATRSQGGFLIIWVSPWECQRLGEAPVQQGRDLRDQPRGRKGIAQGLARAQLVFQKSGKFPSSPEAPCHFSSPTFWPQPRSTCPLALRPPRFPNRS